MYDNSDDNDCPHDDDYNMNKNGESKDMPLTEIIIESDDDGSIVSDNFKNEPILFSRLEDYVYEVDVSSLPFHPHEKNNSIFTIDSIKDPISNRIFVVTGGQDEKVILWDYTNSKKISEHKMVDSVITTSFNPKLKLLLVADLDGRIRLFDYTNIESTLENKVKDIETEFIEVCKWHPYTGNIIVAGRIDWGLQIWNNNTGFYCFLISPVSVPNRLSEYYNGEAPYFTFNKAHPSNLYVGYGDGSVVIWSIYTGSLLHKFKDPMSKFDDMISSIISTNSGKVILAGAKLSTVIKMYNATNYKYLGELESLRSIGNPKCENIVHDLVISDDDQYVVMGIIINKSISIELEKERRADIILKSLDENGNLKNDMYNYALEKSIERTNNKIFLGEEPEYDEDEVMIQDIVGERYDDIESKYYIDPNCRKMEEMHKLYCDNDNMINKNGLIGTNGENDTQNANKADLPIINHLERLFEQNNHFIFDPNEPPPANGSQIVIWNFKYSRCMHVFNFGSKITEIAKFKDDIVIAGFVNGYIVGINYVQGKIVFKLLCPDLEAIYCIKYISRIDAIAVTNFGGTCMLIDAPQILSELQNNS